MNHTPALAVLLLLAGTGLVACNGPAAQQPPTAAAPPPTVSAAAPDTAAPRRAQPPAGPVPFVNGTKVGRLLGPQSPSPAASRTR